MGMSDYAMEVEEQIYEDYALDQQGEEYLEALHYIEEFKAMVKNEDDYADLLLAEEKIIEYKEVYVNNKHDSTNEQNERIERLETFIIDISKKLMEQSPTIPISEKKKITVKDFELLYSIPEETQSRMRGRHKDPLPYTQFSARGNIYYDPKEIDKWMENYKKERR